MANFPQLNESLTRALRDGLAIPAHPLALHEDGSWDERRQRALTRYYHAAGAGGVAVGVHTTQFSIRDPHHHLLRSVLELGAETARDQDRKTGRRMLRIAGVCGRTPQAVQEASLARDLGYDLGLLSLAALKDDPEDALYEHCLQVARDIPLFGFYLQPAVGGRILSRRFWRRFAEIPNATAIKVAPFNRYQTLDVLRAVAESGRLDEIALYTGNDDHIALDLLSEYTIATQAGVKRVRFAGGLLGHWAVWTKRAVEFLEACKQLRTHETIPIKLLAQAAKITEANAALFDAANQYAGCIPGIHFVLQQQGLLSSPRCLDPAETLSPGQADEIQRITRQYPELIDDEFVSQHLDDWLKD